MKTLSKAILKRYVSRIGKEAFYSGWYNTPNGERWRLAVKAMAQEFGGYSLVDRCTFSAKIAQELDGVKKKIWNDAIDKFYCEIA